jgi:hypothetical protein
MQGRSLLPCLDGRSTVQEELLIEYQDNRARQGFDRPACVRTLLTPRSTVAGTSSVVYLVPSSRS